MNLEKNSYEKIIENLHDGLYLVDRNRKITYWNKAAEKISGYSAEEVIGKGCSDHILTHIDDLGNTLCGGLCPLAASIADGQTRQGTIYLHHKNGYRIPVSIRIVALTDKEGKVIGGVEIFSDISNQLAYEAKVRELEKLAYLDNLTQLASRAYIEKEIQSTFEERNRYGLSFGLLFIDVDHFKNFNDKYGHNVGDQVLKFIANTFIANSRPFDLYGRWGGEEFIGIIKNVNKQELELLGNRIRLLIQGSFIIHNQLELNVTISLGATIVRDDDTMENLIKRADMLLYQSKTSGRNRLTLD